MVHGKLEIKTFLEITVILKSLTVMNNDNQTGATSIVGGEPDCDYICLYIVCNQCVLQHSNDS